MMLNSEGNLYRHQNRLEEARKEYEEALKIDRDLAHKNQETYLMSQLMLSTGSGRWGGLQRFDQPSVLRTIMQ